MSEAKVMVWSGWAISSCRGGEVRPKMAVASDFYDAVNLGVPKANRDIRRLHTGKRTKKRPKTGGGLTRWRWNLRYMLAVTRKSDELLGRPGGISSGEERGEQRGG
jgi:hypothetical protein